jgi:hypothetical protein
MSHPSYWQNINTCDLFLFHELKQKIFFERQKLDDVEKIKYNKTKHIYLLTPWRRILFEKLIVTQHFKQLPAFSMEPEGPLPFSQKPATGPYPEPAESSSPHQSLSP